MAVFITVSYTHLDVYKRQAFSSGVDSTFLLAAAKEALGDKVIALTAKSCLFPERESGEAKDFCKNLGVEQIVLDLGCLLYTSRCV